MVQGYPTEALTAFDSSLAINKQLAEADPGNLSWLSEMVGAYSRVGDDLLAQGHSTAALKMFSASLAVSERLPPVSDPLAARSGGLVRNVGDRLKTQRNLDEALRPIAKASPFSNARRHRPQQHRWQSDLSVAYDKFRNVLRAQSKFDEALKPIAQRYLPQQLAVA